MYSGVQTNFYFFIFIFSRSGARAYVVSHVARARALAAYARDATGGAREEGLGVRAALRPGGAAGTAPQP